MIFGARTRRVLLLVGAVFAATTGPHATGTTTTTFTVFGPKTLTRTAGAPDVFNFTFTLANPALPYTLRIDNHGVDCATVTLNGVQIIGPSECRSRGGDDWKKSRDWDDDDWDDDRRD